MPRIAALLGFACLMAAAHPLHSCTILATAQEGRVLVANNEDFVHPFTSVWCVPAGDGEYGRILFGLETGLEELAALGGINDQGLFIDGNGISNTDWEPVPGRENYKGIVEAHILANHATVAEAVEWFRTTNVPIMKRAKFLLADRTGASAVVEWSGGELQVIPRAGDYQVSTNFRQSEQEPGRYPCFRYRTADTMLDEADAFTVDLLRGILAATHFEGAGSTTLYSYIGDLTAGKIYIYNFHNFEDVVVFDVKEKLAGGYAQYRLPRLFPRLTYAQLTNAPRLVGNLLRDLHRRKGATGLAEDLSEFKQLSEACFDRDLTESIVNNLGYSLLGENRAAEAVEVFRLNVAQHPESGNVYDSLGEACLAARDTVQAVTNYRESLRRDPGNDNAKAVLGRLGAALE